MKNLFRVLITINLLVSISLTACSINSSINSSQTSSIQNTQTFQVNYTTSDGKASISNINITQTDKLVAVDFSIKNNTDNMLSSNGITIVLYNKENTEIGTIFLAGKLITPNSWAYMATEENIISEINDLLITSVHINFSVYTVY